MLEILEIIITMIIIFCILTFIFLMLMAMGIVPCNSVVKFLKRYKILQFIFAIMAGTGLLSTFAIIFNNFI